ncbi:hypothetical protein HYG93_07585 [Acinetobacter sp. SwsAc6]|uniref:hypothetical protein n=1 Tax=Acinetobacter sp. SwsAc6 TaxID=2749439 RepID=UPI0015B8260C|nr:hypothetical protein [Acinetobacter sp. SwsAc6]NWK74151.1 hypothetical protein [Acinetobacter sp. SwsAc6]
MPKVKFLKDLCSGRAGTVQSLQDYEANVLIKMGAAEIFDDSEQTEAARLAAEKEYEQIPPDALLNLNGRPVVDDFGDVAQQPEPLPETEKPAKKGSKASK